METRVAWSSDFQYPVDLNWRFPYSLESRGHLFYPLFFFSLSSDFRSYFLPSTPLFPHFGTSVEAERALSKALKPKDVENLYASDFSMYIREEAELSKIKICYWSWDLFLFVWYHFSCYLSNCSSEILHILELFWVLWSSSHYTLTHPSSETDNMVQNEAKELIPGTSRTDYVVCSCLSSF